MCNLFWRMIQQIGSAARSLWQPVYGAWKMCSEQPCSWWCLCCNKWLCWFLVILLAILMIVIIVLYVIMSFVGVVICELLCILFAILQFPVSCFQYQNDSPNPPPPPGPGTGTGTGTDGFNPPVGAGTGTGTGTGTGPTDRSAIACGCREGLIGAMLAVGLFMIWLALEPAAIRAQAATDLAGYGVATFLAGALIGKLAGLYRARALP
jgi:hypothetical protein